jgi:hypothetical protein
LARVLRSPFRAGRFAGDKRRIPMMTLTIAALPAAAAGWAFLVWLFGGGLGLALLVFLVLKMLGK